jgi:pimeloyl-ACP methyl ester carboxylesterase
MEAGWLAHPTQVTRRSRQRQDGPSVLVGHSYGGAVISEAGTHPAVAALVYIVAFAPDKGESVDTLIADPPPGAGTPDPAAPVRLPVPRPRQVRGLLRRKLTYEIATD